jgi:HEAT repeat protein
LIGVFAEDDDNLAGRATQALTGIGVPALPQVIDALQSENARTRAYAAFALGRIDAEVARSAPLLIGLLRDADEAVRDRATTALAGLGEAAVPYLVRALSDAAEWRARAHAALALGQMTPPSGDAVRSLTAALEDQHPTVRQIACWSLGKVGKAAASAVKNVTALLRSSDIVLRRTAAWTLGNIGPAALSAEPAIEALLGDPEPTVREEADEALQKLRGTYQYATPEETK